MANNSSAEVQTVLFDEEGAFSPVASSPPKRKRGRPKKESERQIIRVAPPALKPLAHRFWVERANGDEQGRLRCDGLAREVAAEMEVWVEEIVVSHEDDERSRRLEIEWPPGCAADVTEVLALAVMQSAENLEAGRQGPDLLRFAVPGGLREQASGEDAVWTAPILLAPVPDGVACRIHNSVFRFRARRYLERQRPENEDGEVTTDLASVHEWLRERNAHPELQKLLLDDFDLASADAAQGADGFNYHTGQEWTAFLHTATDGKRLRYFVGDVQGGTLRHHRPNAPFWTETALTEDERRAGHGIELLQSAASELDLDDALAWLYISHLIAPNAPLPSGNYAGGWIDLDDVARKTMGGYARNPAEALARRRKIWHAIRYGTRTQIIGTRSVPYFDKTTGQQIDTQVATSPWQIVKEQKPVQASLLPDDDVPVRVELVASREWTLLTTSPDTAQFLPAGELLGAIPPSQASGAWARALGMAYFHWCRCHLLSALDGHKVPTRDALLNQFPNKKINHTDVLSSPNPRRAMQYWAGAEALLIEIGIIEAVPSTREAPMRQGWQKEWLESSPEWKPGPKLRPLLEALAQNVLPKRPVALANTQRKRGRPRKYPAP